METSAHPTIDDDRRCRRRVARRDENRCGEPPWRVYKLWAEDRLQGVWKDGRDLFASKRALRRAHHNRARTGK